MKNTMYIVRTKENWYQLRVTFNHCVLGCGADIDKLLNTVRKYVLQYKKTPVFEQAVLNMEYNYIPKGVKLEQCVYEYQHRDEYINRQLEDTVLEALREVRQNTPLKKVRSRLKGTRTVSTVPVEVPRVEERRPKRNSKVLLPLRRLNRK